MIFRERLPFQVHVGADREGKRDRLKNKLQNDLNDEKAKR
jgi:hypothetical protein